MYVTILLVSVLKYLSTNAQPSSDLTSKKEALVKDILLHTIAAKNSTNQFESKGVEVICLRNNMCIVISSLFYQQQDIPLISWDSLKLSDECPNAVVSDPNVEARTLCTTEGFMTCGTEMLVNDTHVIFRNTLRTHEVEDEMYPNVVVGSYKSHIVPWECTYPLNYLVSLSSESLQSNFHYLPVASQIRQIIFDMGDSGTGYGRFHVWMHLYASSAYMATLAQAPRYNMNDTMYVGIALLNGPFDAVIQVKQCWGTPTENPDDIRRFVLIERYCPRFNFIEFHEKDLSNRFRWSSPVFRFKNSTSVYLHCEVRICFFQFQTCTNRSQCPPSAATSRKKRSSKIKATSDKVLSIGPITLVEDVRLVEDHLETLEGISYDQDSKNDIGWMLAFAILLVVSLIFLLILIAFIFRTVSKRYLENHS